MGYVGANDCVDYLITGLKRLEYRGYDSSGISVMDSARGAKSFEIVKAQGKLENIESILKQTPIYGNIGIGHTRWATHGKPNSINAHPHRAGTTVLVHNGIIENYDSIRIELIKKGYKIISETDSELFGHLVEDEMKNGKEFNEAVRSAFLKLEGSCSIVVVNDKHPDRILAIRNGTPLVAAFSSQAKGSFVASDAQAIIEHSNQITYLENEDLLICTQSGITIHSLREPISVKSIIKRMPTTLDWTVSSMDKAGYPHFMLKEIFEQPRAVLDTLDSLIDRTSGKIKFEELKTVFEKINRIQIVACGTAWHAGLIGKYIFEKSSRIPVEVDLASEYRYREPVITNETLFLAVSQSGETADTLAALREAKRLGAKTAAICNVRGSSLAREADFTLFTAAGPEIGVASTKAFTTQILALMMMGEYLGQIKNPTKSAPFNLHFYLRLPHLIQSALDTDSKIKKIAKESLDQSKGFLYIARGRNFPIALEGALKMKEITYLHAEGYPAGELKHGPIAMVDSTMTMVVICPRDELFDKTISNLQEVKARGGRIVSIGNKGDEQLRKLSDYFLEYDFEDDFSDVILAAIPIQLLAYHAAVMRGTDVDKPRNLAKSVTVE